MNIFSEQAFNFLLNFNTKTYCIILKIKNNLRSHKTRNL